MAVEAGFAPSEVAFDQNPRLAPPSLDAPIWSTGRLHLDINPITEAVAWLVSVVQQAEVARGLLEQKVDLLAANQGGPLAQHQGAPASVLGDGAPASVLGDGVPASSSASVVADPVTDPPGDGGVSSATTASNNDVSGAGNTTTVDEMGRQQSLATGKTAEISPELEERIHLLERKVAVLTLGLGPPVDPSSRRGSKRSVSGKDSSSSSQVVQRDAQESKELDAPRSAEVQRSAEAQRPDAAQAEEGAAPLDAPAKLLDTVRKESEDDADHATLRTSRPWTEENDPAPTEDLVQWIQSVVTPMIEGHAASAANGVVDPLRNHIHTLDHMVSELATAGPTQVQREVSAGHSAGNSSAAPEEGKLLLPLSPTKAALDDDEALSPKVQSFVHGVVEGHVTKAQLQALENKVHLLSKALESAAEGKEAGSATVLDIARQVSKSSDRQAYEEVPAQAPALVANPMRGQDTAADDLALLKEQVQDLDRKVALLTIGLGAAAEMTAKDHGDDEAQNLERRVLDVLEKEVGVPPAAHHDAESSAATAAAEGDKETVAEQQRDSQGRRDSWVKALLDGDPSGSRSFSLGKDLHDWVRERVPAEARRPSVRVDDDHLKREVSALRQELLELKMGVDHQPSGKLESQASVELKEAIAAGNGATTPSASSVGGGASPPPPVSRAGSMAATKDRFGFVSKEMHEQLMRQVNALEKEHKKLSDKVSKPRVRMDPGASASDKEEKKDEDKEVAVTPMDLESFREELWVNHQRSIQRLELALGNLQQTDQQVTTDMKRLRQDVDFLEERMNEDGVSPRPTVAAPEPAEAPPTVAEDPEGDTGGDDPRVAFTKKLYEWIQGQLAELQNGMAQLRASAGEELKGRAKKEVADLRRDNLRRFAEIRQELDQGLAMTNELKPHLPKLLELADAGSPAAVAEMERMKSMRSAKPDEESPALEGEVSAMRTQLIDVHDAVRDLQRKAALAASQNQQKRDEELDQRLLEQKNEITAQLRTWFQDQLSRLKDSLAVVDDAKQGEGRAVVSDPKKESRLAEADKRMLRQLVLRVSALEDAPRIELDMISQQVVANQRELRRQLSRMEQLEQTQREQNRSPQQKLRRGSTSNLSPKGSDRPTDHGPAVEDLKRELGNVMTALRGMQRDAEAHHDKLADVAQTQARVEQGLPVLQRLLQEMVQLLSNDLDPAIRDHLARVQGLFGVHAQQQDNAQQPRPVTQGSLRRTEEKIRTDMQEGIQQLRDELKSQLGNKADQTQLEGLHHRMQNVAAQSRDAAATFSAADDGREPAAWRVQFGRCIVCDSRVEVGVDPNSAAPWAQKPGATIPNQAWPMPRSLTNLPTAPQLRLNPVTSSSLPGPAPVPRRPPSPTQPRGVLPPIVPQPQQQPMLGDKPAVSSA